MDALELTRAERAAIRGLVKRWCANYDPEYGCLPLDCECYIHYNFIGVLDMPEVASLPSSVTIDTRQGVAVEYITRKAG